MYCFAPIRVKNPSYHGFPTEKEYNIIPCGRCEACAKRNQQERFVRLKLAVENSVYTCFVTLTYNEDEEPEGHNVCKKDVQLFNKRLRSKFNHQIKYYVTSEYGPENGRPHYHGIYFNIRPKDWHCIEEAWQKGFCEVSEVTNSRIMYCAGYITEKLCVPDGREPLFNLISNGLGQEYIGKMIKWHKDAPMKDRCYTAIYNQKFILPRYLRDRIYTPAERKVYADQMLKEADERFQKRVERIGLDQVFRSDYSARLQFAKEVREKHKKKKQIKWINK